MEKLAADFSKRMTEFQQNLPTARTPGLRLMLDIIVSRAIAATDQASEVRGTCSPISSRKQKKRPHFWGHSSKEAKGRKVRKGDARGRSGGRIGLL
jgi:hypothetical protein